MKVELSEKQKSVVYSESETIYVKASAGSGKTRVLTERVRYLLTKTDKKILVLTFTNKAGEEIKERLRDVENLNERTFIGTFHSFCQSILEMRIHLLGFKELPHIFENENDRLELIGKSIQQVPSYSIDYSKLNSKEKGDFRYRVLNFISKMKRNLISENEIQEHIEDENIILLYRTYQEILKNQNAIDYDDLLLLAYEIFVNFPKITSLYRRSFFSICIDEAQDLNNAQYQFLKVLANKTFQNIMMVGDPNQSIFHFNGSSPDYMDKHFKDDFKPDPFVLTENYRSSISVLKMANKLIPNSESIEGVAKQGIFELYGISNEIEEAKWVINKIEELIQLKSHEDIEGDITYEKIVVLARNKYLFNILEEELENNKLPYYYKVPPGALKFESNIMKIFDLSLKVKLNSFDTLHFNRLLKLLNLEEVTKTSFDGIIDQIKDISQREIIELVISLNNDGNDFNKKIDTFKESVQVTDEDEKQMVINDIRELQKHWHIYAKNTDNKSLIQFKNAMSLGKTNPNTQHNGITLSTVHTMKGQEFEIVFIIGMDDGTFPDYRAIKEGGIEITQEKNNLYVAFTRAKRWLYVTYPRKRTMPWGDKKSRKISRFLKSFDCKEL